MPTSKSASASRITTILSTDCGTTETDAYFVAGHTHAVCEDYALARDDYVILADGCSSSKHTDFGARLLVHAVDGALAAISRHDTWPDYNRVLDYSIAVADANCRAIGLPRECLDATLGFVRCAEGRFDVVLQGDGCIIAKRRSGLTNIYLCEYPSGAPDYLSYRLDCDRRLAYIETFGCAVQRDGFVLVKDGTVICGTLEQQDTRDLWVKQFSCSDFEFVGICSDGILTFEHPVVTETSRSYTPTFLGPVVHELAAFKSHKGKFIQRRVKRYLKECVAQQHRHLDDLSFAGIYAER